MPVFRPNTLYYGDNMTVLRDFPPECVDLIYLDPPFNSNRSYNVLFKEGTGREAEAQIQAFEDTWHWGQATSATHETYNEFVSRGTDDARILEAFVHALGHNDVTAYLTMMAPRLVELRRVLKPTGSIYLHCDPTAGHYLKVLMDAVFGAVNFRNEIVWKRSHAHSSAKRYGPIHDLLYFYTKSDEYTWTDRRQDYSADYVERFFKFDDADGRGRYWTGDLTGNGTRRGETGQVWKGFDPTVKGRHWMYPPRVLDELDADLRIYWPKSQSAWPKLKRYLAEAKGTAWQDIFDDIYSLQTMGGNKGERLGYPTQKPEALLARVIEASSNPGDLVLDPFCGCGTAVVAAHRLGRQWVGIDITYLAVDLMVDRLKTTFPNDFPDGVQVDGEPADEAAALSLAARDKFQFQFWSVASVGGTARGGENRKGADRGIDGVMTFPELDPNGELKAQAGRVSRRTKRAPLTTPNIVYKQVLISVKGGATGPHHVRELIGTVDREAAAIGVLVTARQPTSEMYREAADAGVYHSPSTGKSYPKIQIITAGEIIQGKRIDTPPKRGLTQYQPAPRARRGEQGVLRELQAPYIVSSEPVEDDLRAAPDDEDQDDFDQQDTKT